MSLLVAAGVLMLSAFGTPRAHAIPPAHGLTKAQAADAAAVIEDAADRGVAELPASPFLELTACGTAGAIRTRAARAHRTALVSLRRIQRARGTVHRAQRRVRLARVALRAASSRVVRQCLPETASTSTDEDVTLRGTTTTQRPRAVVSGRSLVVALPVEFADVRADRAAHAPSRYEQMLFGAAYPHGGGSLAAYFRDMSYGAFTVDGDVAAWRRMPKRRAAYAADAGGMGAYPANSQLLLEDAVRANDAAVDFSDYDNDGADGRPNSGDDDGFVDSVFLVYAGTSSAENGNLDALWPHAWRHTVATRDRSANGGFVKVGRYAAVPERMEEPGPDGDLLTVGVVAHEFGHVLGLPDLVDGEDGHAGPGDWDLMGTGMWGFEHSSRPSGMSAWSRARLGWVTPQLLEGDHVGHELGSSYAQRSVVKLPVAGAPLHEHFLVERRTRTGFDADAPDDGLLVWHVDDSVGTGAATAHPRVELVAADGAANGDSGDLLRAGGALSDASTPSARAHDGDASLVVIQNVQDTSVDLHAGSASLAPTIDASIDDAGPQAAPPVATLTAPVAGARVRGTITLACTATGNPNLNRLTFYRDSTTALTNIAVTGASTSQTFAFNTATRPNGPNTLACRARNTSNQWSPYSNAAVVIDNAVPATPTMSAPPIAPTWLRGTVAWTATGTDNYGVTNFSYRVDGVDNWQTAWTELTPKSNTFNWDTTTVTNGAHVLTVRSQDLAGNISAISANRNVSVDNALPTMPVPADGTVLPDIDEQTSTTTLNARWTAGTDAHSGMSSYSWRFCTTPACGTVVASGSGAGLTATAGTLSLADGLYYACVRAIDVAGNQSADSCSDGVLVDTLAPTMTTPMDATTAPDLDAQTSTTTLDAVWTAANDGAGTGVAGYDWRFCTTPGCTTILGSGSTAGLTATAGSLSLTVGSTYFACVRARDQLSNTSAYACSDGIIVDGPPVVTITTPATGSVATGTLAVNATATDATGIVQFEWRVDGVLQQTDGPLAALSPRSIGFNWNTALPVTEGPHTIEVTAFDSTMTTDTDTITVIVDRTAPTLTNAGITDGSIVNGTINLTSSSSDPGGVDRVEYRIDGTTVLTSPGGGATTFNDSVPFNTATLLEGNHAYYAFGFDVAGNAAATTSPERYFIVNNNVEGVAPTGTMTSPAAGPLAATNVTLSANVADNNVIVRVEFRLDGVAIPGVAPFVAPPGFTGGVVSRTWSNTGGVAAGPHTLTARVTDASGNTFTTPGIAVTK